MIPASVILTSLRLQGYSFNFKKCKENLCDYSNGHLYKDVLKVKELIHHVNFVADDATPIALTIDIIMKPTKNDNFYIKLSN